MERLRPAAPLRKQHPENSRSNKFAHREVKSPYNATISDCRIEQTDSVPRHYSHGDINDNFLRSAYECPARAGILIVTPVDQGAMPHQFHRCSWLAPGLQVARRGADDGANKAQAARHQIRVWQGTDL